MLAIINEKQFGKTIFFILNKQALFDSQDGPFIYLCQDGDLLKRRDIVVI